MENLEKYRKEIFKDETSAGDEGVIAESIDIVNDKFGLNQEQMLQALNFLYSIKDSFLGRTKKEPFDNIVSELSSKIIKYLIPSLIVSENDFEKEIDKFLLTCGYKIFNYYPNNYLDVYNLYHQFQKETANYDFDINSVSKFLEWFKNNPNLDFNFYFDKEEKENIVKEVCKELNITQKELSEILGVHLTTIQKWVANDNDLPLQAKKSLNLVLENHHLKTRLKTLDEFVRLFKELQK
ncbi:TPA: helix-turn-helix domain-containing protein [Campylobacter jejuni]